MKTKLNGENTLSKLSFLVLLFYCGENMTTFSENSVSFHEKTFSFLKLLAFRSYFELQRLFDVYNEAHNNVYWYALFDTYHCVSQRPNTECRSKNCNWRRSNATQGAYFNLKRIELNWIGAEFCLSVNSNWQIMKRPVSNKSYDSVFEE